MNKDFQPEYIANIENVRETILVGAVDLAFWHARLKQEDLFPFNLNGRAQIMISATQLKWSGIPSRELVISIAVCQRAAEDPPDGAYLIHAFSSSRMLAFAERAFFQTPYAWGKIEAQASIPAFIAFNDGNGAMFRVQMLGTPSRLRGEEELLEGAIFLPRTGTQTGNVFYAKLGGYTEAYPFAPGESTLELRPSPRAPVFQWLVESHFAPQEWRLRSNATHARSKTYKRI